MAAVRAIVGLAAMVGVRVLKAPAGLFGIIGLGMVNIVGIVGVVVLVWVHWFLQWKR